MSKPTKHFGKWRIRWIDADSKRKSAVFDSHKEAARILKQLEIEAEEQRLGIRPKPPPPRTFADASKYWKEHRAPQKRSHKDDISILRQLDAHFARVSLLDTTAWVMAVDSYKAKKAKLHKKTLRNHLMLLGTVLRAAHDLGWMPELPKINKPRVRLNGNSYAYLRTDEEIRRFLRAAAAEGTMIVVLYTMAILTGARAGELAALQWDDVDFEQRLLTIQRSFDGPTKSEDIRYVPIFDALLPVLRRWRLQHPGKLVFTNRDGRMLGRSARAFQEVLHRVLAAAEFPTVERNGKQRRYIRFHDLRHTFASCWMAKGGDLFKLQRLLGHKSVTMTLRYAHLQPAAFREDYGRFTGLTDAEAKVLTLRSSRTEEA